MMNKSFVFTEGKKRLTLLCSVLLLQIGILCWLSPFLPLLHLPSWEFLGRARDEGGIHNLKVGKSAPSLMLKDEADHPIGLGSVQGKEVALLFVSSCSHG